MKMYNDTASQMTSGFWLSACRTQLYLLFLAFTPVFCSHGLCVWRWLTPTQAAGRALETWLINKKMTFNSHEEHRLAHWTAATISNMHFRAQVAWQKAAQPTCAVRLSDLQRMAEWAASCQLASANFSLACIAAERDKGKLIRHTGFNITTIIQPFNMYCTQVTPTCALKISWHEVSSRPVTLTLPFTPIVLRIIIFFYKLTANKPDIRQ